MITRERKVAKDLKKGDTLARGGTVNQVVPTKKGKVQIYRGTSHPLVLKSDEHVWLTINRKEGSKMPTLNTTNPQIEGPIGGYDLDDRAEAVKEQWVNDMINDLALRSKELKKTIEEDPSAAEVSYLKWLLDQNEDKLLRLLTI